MVLNNISQLFSPSFLSESPLTKTLGEEFVLCENGNMVFHWADFHETCDLVKARLESDEVLRRDFELRALALSRLALIPVWVKTENRVHQTTMHELYEKYILNFSQLLGGIDPFCPLEISFISGTGPFKSLSIADCFNTSTYRDFVLVYLIQGKLPRRDYRVRLKSKILMEFGESYSKAELVSVEQLTINGLLLSMDSEVYFRKLAASESVRLLVHSRMLGEARGKSIDELKAHLSQYAFNLLYSSQKEDGLYCCLSDFSVQSSFDYSKNKKVFLFISYDKLAESHPASVKMIRDFVMFTRDIVKDYYAGKKAELKSA